MMTPILSRREFLRTAAIGATAASLLPRLAGATATPARIKVGAHPWVYAAKMPGNDFTPLLPEIFADFKAAGFDGIELMNMVLRHDDAVARIGALSRQHGLPVIGTSFNGPMWDRAQHATVLGIAETVMTRLAELGGRTFGTSVGPLPPSEPKRRKTEVHFDAQAECLTQIIALGKKLGVVVNLHNHTYEVENDFHDLNGTLARLPEVKLGPDLNWLIRGGGDPVAFIRRHGKRIVFLHLRDQVANGRWVESMGEGTTDFAAIAAALREVGFAGDAVIELAHEKDFTPTRPFRESFQRSREFVRRTMAI